MMARERPPELPAGDAPECPLCRSSDLAHYAMAWGDIPPGTRGFIGCRRCLAWWSVESVGAAVTIFTRGAWRIVEHGVGHYASAEEREHTRRWRAD